MFDYPKHLTTGIAIIDYQHEELFSKVEELFEMCTRGKGENEIIDMLTYLKRYAEEHFKTEEEYMLQYNYPSYMDHLNAHAEFIVVFQGLQKMFKSEGVTPKLLYQISTFLQRWLTSHMENEDKKLTEFIRSSKVQQAS